MAFDKWTLLKVFEVGFVVSCLVCKRVTDDEASRLFLYLQKLSREWSLLNNVTWDRIGAAVADATYGGYVIITTAFLIGKITGDLPTTRRISEMIILGIGALLFVVLGSLEFAALDSVPPDLVDNAAVLGTLSLIAGALFLLDLGAPKAKKVVSEPPKTLKVISSPLELTTSKHEVVPIEPELEKLERKEPDALDEHVKKLKASKEQKNSQNGFGPKITAQNGFKNAQNGYKKMKEKDVPKRFDIYGKDAEEYKGTESGGEGHRSSEEIEQHSPVWSQIRKEPSVAYQGSQPSSPGDPGYVQYTAQRWGQRSQKTPRHSPTQV